jgi:uncharacterized membrane protein
MKINNLFWLGWFLFGASPAIAQHAMIHDTAVGRIKMGDPESTVKVLGPRIWEKHFEGDGLLPRIEVINRDSTQVLRLMIEYGGIKNSANQLQILAVDSRYKFPRKAVRVNVDKFTSGLKVSLSQKKESVIRVLGKDYKVLAGKGGDEEIIYESSETDELVKRYNEYKYFIRCVFRKGVLVNYWFGFEPV